EVPDRLAGDVGLGDLPHGDRGLHAGVDTDLLEEVLQREAVHHGAKHAHVVRPGAVHALLLELGTTEEVAAADDDGDLHAVTHGRGDLGGHAPTDIRRHAHLAATEDLAGELEEDPASSLGGGLFGHGRAPWDRMRIRRGSSHTWARFAEPLTARSRRAAFLSDGLGRGNYTMLAKPGRPLPRLPGGPPLARR